MGKPELFILTNEALQATNRREVQETIKAMMELGIAKTPAENFMIAVDLNIYTGSFFDAGNIKESKELISFWQENSPNDFMLLQFMNVQDGYSDPVLIGWINVKTLKITKQPAPLNIEYDANQHWAHVQICFALIVLLATRNVEKNRVENTRSSASAKRRNASQYASYTTTIRIGQITKSYGASDGSGGPKRPHLRRGHVRNQRVGEGRKDTKQIFISPIFVNADKGWVESQRKAYIVKT